MTGSQTLVVRADANVAKGTGHVMRCLALAQAWQDGGGEVVFAMAESTPAVDERLRSERVQIVQLKTAATAEDAAQVADLAHAHHANWVVVDGYEFDAEYQRSLKNARLKLMLVDDNGHAGHYFADIVLNQNVHATEDLYRSREGYTRLLLGPRYAMLRREFWPWRKWKREIPLVGRKVLVTMGGSDPDNMSLRVVECLDGIKMPGLEITVVIGGSSPYLRQIEQAVARCSSRIRLLAAANNIPELMMENDTAVIAAGGTLWELLFMGCAVLSYARNPVQARVVHDLERVGAVRSMGASNALDFGGLASVLHEVLASRVLRAQMATAGQSIVDGRGATRAVQALAPEVILK